MRDRSPYQLDCFEISDADKERLKQSIAEFGLEAGEEPVVDLGGNILDGHCRAAVCAELGISYTPRIVAISNENEKWEYIIRKNLARRHLTIEQKRGVAVEIKKRKPELSLRAIARVVGLSHNTVQDAILTDELSGGQIDQSEDNRTPLEVSDHRNEVWFAFTVGYPKKSEEERKRKDLPYPRESVREEWSPGRAYLTVDFPETREDAVHFANEVAKSIYRQLVSQFEL